MRRLFTMCLVALASVMAFAQEKDPAQVIQDLDAKRIQALLKSDTNAILKMYGSTFVQTSARGVRTRGELVAALRSGDLKYESIRTRDVKVQFSGANKNVAVETGIAAVRGTDRGTELPRESRFTRVWLRSEGQWRLIAQHSSPLEQ